MVREGGWNLEILDDGSLRITDPNGQEIGAPPTSVIGAEEAGIMERNQARGLDIDDMTGIPRWYGSGSCLGTVRRCRRELDGFVGGARRLRLSPSLGRPSRQSPRPGGDLDSFRFTHPSVEDDNGMVHAAAMSFELHIPASRSLKAKRAAIRPIVDGMRHRFRISVAEVDHQDQWQRATIAVAVVAGSERRVRALLDAAERFVAGAPDIELLRCETAWLELEEA